MVAMTEGFRPHLGHFGVSMETFQTNKDQSCMEQRIFSCQPRTIGPKKFLPGGTMQAKVWTQMFMQRVAPPKSETAADVTNWTSE